jgi:uncharacterized protein YlzI (FlbEa/FlbD family)
VEIDMALIKLRGANEAGEEAGVLFVNTDQIAAISAGPNATEVQMVDGRTRWVKDAPDAVVSLVKAAG